MKIYTKPEKKMQNKTFMERKRELGWKQYNFIVPLSIGEEILTMKRQRMDEYKKAQNNFLVKS